MKRFLIFPCILSLIIGLLAGILLPIDLSGEEKPPAGVSQPEGSSSGTSSASSAPLDSEDNFSLLAAACAINRCLQRQDWSTLSAYVHPERGVTFTPYSTVDLSSDRSFTADQIKNLAQDKTVYTWGFEDGRGEPIQMTALQYFERYIYDRDYTQVSEIGVDRIMTSGNALENLAEVYPGCRFVDFSFPSADPVNDGLDWTSLKLVLQPGEEHWYLVGVVHGEWTI